MTGSGDQPDDETLAALDRDRQVVRVSQLGQLDEESGKVVVGVPDQPLLHDRAVTVNDAHAVVR